MSALRKNPEHPIETLFADRWSPRSFAADKPVTKEVLLQCLEAARWAPSCFGDQPWRFVVCDRHAHESSWQRLLDTLAEKNQRWARSAPVLILTLATEHFSHGDHPNRWAGYDTGAAAISLCLQAEALGLACHQMGGFDVAAVRKAFDIDTTHTPMSVIALGHVAEPEILDEDFRGTETAARARLPLADIARFGEWLQS